jgi:hypothetical protein
MDRKDGFSIFPQNFAFLWKKSENSLQIPALSGKTGAISAIAPA